MTWRRLLIIALASFGGSAAGVLIGRSAPTVVSLTFLATLLIMAAVAARVTNSVK